MSISPSHESSPVQAIAEAEEVYVFPTSFAQQRLWFLDRFDPGRASYNISGATQILGPLDVKALEKTLQEIVRRHETLRTRFVVIKGEPQQAIDPHGDLQLSLIDLESLPEEAREATARMRARKEARTPFDLEHGPLLRVKLLRLSSENHVLILTIHHIVSDGWSAGVLMRELSVLYGAFSTGRPSPLPELPIQYADYAVWQRERMKGEFLAQQVGYWKNQLQNPAPPLNLPLDRPRPSLITPWGDNMTITLPGELTRKLKGLSEQQGATLYMVLMAALQILLYRYTGQQDVSVGTPIAGRQRTETEGLIGFFINTLVIRTKLSPDWNFLRLLERVKETMLEAHAHQEVPFEMVVDAVTPDRDISRTPLFQVGFVYQNAPASPLQLGPTQLRPFKAHSGTTKFDISFALWEANDRLEGSVEYSTDLFDRSTIISLFDRLHILLDSIASNPDQSLSELPVLAAGEYAALVSDSRASETAYVSLLPIWQSIELHAQRSPEAPAIVANDETITYGSLNQRIRGLARRLRSQGIKPGTRVGILLDKGADLLVAALAVLKTNSIFVPLNPKDPDWRIRHIINDAGLKSVVADGKFSDLLPELLETLWLSEQEAGEDEEIDSGLRHETSYAADLSSPACLLYRSGSGGLPEAVLVKLGALSRTFSFADEWERKPSDRILQGLNFDHETACFEIFGALSSGACVVDMPEPPVLPGDVVGLIRDHAVTTLCCSALLLERLAKDFPQALKKLHRIFCDDDPIVFYRFQGKLKPEVANRVYGLRGSPESGGPWLQCSLGRPPKYLHHRPQSAPPEGPDACRLKNGMVVLGNRNEVDFLYDEIFARQGYLRCGVELRPGFCIFDVGANIGMFTLFAGELCRNGKIFAFEPAKPLYDKLVKNIGQCAAEVKTFRLALSDREDEGEFTYYPNFSIMSGLSHHADSLAADRLVKRFITNHAAQQNPSAPPLEQYADQLLQGRFHAEKFTCQLRRLSSIIREEQIERIDLLKVNVEGAELEVLQGIDAEDWDKITQIVIATTGDQDHQRAVTARLMEAGFNVNVEQDPLFRETGVYNLYAWRPAADLKESSQIATSSPSALQVASDVRLHLLDSRLEPVPDDFIGEVYLESELVAEAYCGLPLRTAAEFVPHPFTVLPGSRLYRTGDLARRRRNGDLEYLGRADRRVVIGGIRVEPAEIELALARHRTIREAATAMRLLPGTRGPVIDAFVVAAIGQFPLAEDLRAFLRQSLPEFMLPASITVLEAIPRRSDGKPDEAALVRILEQQEKSKKAAAPYVAPRNATEEKLAHIWKQALGREKVSVHDNFFRLGGHSLIATQVVARIVDTFHVDLALRKLFEAPTISELAKLIEYLTREEVVAGVSAGVLPEIERVARGTVNS